MKLIVLFSMLVLSVSAFAKIPDNCKPYLEDAIKMQNDFEAQVPQLLASGELTTESLAMYRDAFLANGESVGIYCSNLRVTELQESSRNVSPKKLQDESKKTYDEVVAYYKKRTTK